MSVSNGALANQTTFNTAFMSRTVDTSTVGVVDLNNTATAASGSEVTNAQREHNSIASYTGKSLNSTKTDLPAWVDTSVGAGSNNLCARAEALTVKFNSSTGHAHTGIAGDGPLIAATSVSAVPLKEYIRRGADLASITGATLVVTTEMTGKVNSTSTTVAGVIVTAPYNKCELLQNTGTTQGDSYKDASGNIVFGRITWSASVWTLSFFTDVAGTETAYSFAASDIRWFYGELFNPLGSPPVYDERKFIPSDNATQDIIAATTAIQGKTLLSSATSADIASAGTAGTANATVANADHTHRGILSANKLAGTTLYGAVTFSEGANITLTQVGQDIAIAKPDTHRAQSVAVSSGVKTKVVTFSSTMGTANYAVTCQLVNLTDASPQFQPVTVTAKSATGFTALWNANTDTANYLLEYSAVLYV